MTPVRQLRDFVRRRRLFLMILVPLCAMIAFTLLAMDFGDSPQALDISLDDPTVGSQVHPATDADVIGMEPEVFRVAISGVTSPTKTMADYQELLAYIGARLDKKVEMVLKPTYAEVNELVRNSYVDLAFVCSLAYVQGRDDFGMELLVAPQIKGETAYYSYLIVPADSGASSLDDLRGTSFGFTDPMSNSGHLVPTLELKHLGETPVTFFDQHVYTYSHDNSIVAVADGLLDGAAVDSLVYDQLVALETDLAAKTKIIARWGPYGIPPVVINPETPPELKRQLRNIFLNLHQDEDGQYILTTLDIDRFLEVSPSAYDSIRDMKDALGW
jgi:phosphonate transport system substrate-binding protein